MKRKPRIKEEHRFLLKKISDGIRDGKSMGKVMLELGYSDSYSKNTNHLKETDSWQALLDEQIPDALLTKTMRGLLVHKQWRARDAGLDKALKTKNKYAPTTFLHTIKRPIGEVEDEIAKTLSEISELIRGKK